MVGAESEGGAGEGVDHVGAIGGLCERLFNQQSATVSGGENVYCVDALIAIETQTRGIGGVVRWKVKMIG